jgi:hypothetical protein
MSRLSEKKPDTATVTATVTLTDTAADTAADMLTAPSACLARAR